MFVRAKKRGSRTYPMVVKSERVDGKTKQTVLHSLGRLARLRESGELHGLLASAQRFSDRCAVLDAHDKGESITTKTHAVGPSLVFERLWETLGVRKCFAARLLERRFGFDVERAIFLTVLHRLFESGSDRQRCDGKPTSASMGPGGCNCTRSTGSWRGSARNCPRRSRRARQSIPGALTPKHPHHSW